MRIAIVAETFLPKIDGISNTLCYLLKYLAANGHETFMFAPKGAPEKYADTPIIPVPGMRFPLYPELKLLSPWVNLAQPLDDFKPDLIHVVSPILLGIPAFRYGRMRRIPTVASFHTDIPGFARRWGLGFLGRPIWSWLRWLHNQADLNLCPSRATQKEMIAEGFNNVRIWTRGVDVERFSPTRRNPAVRRRLLGYPDQVPTSALDKIPLLIYVGRLSAEKRIDWLLPVIQALPKARLAIVGDGPQRKQLEALFAGTPTTFTGYLGGTDLAEAYASADIFVFPAANETLGNVALEGMASGLPVVAPRAGGLLDTVIEHQTGLFFEPEDRSSLIAAVTQLVKNPSLRTRMGDTAFQTMQNRTWKHIFDKLIQDYQALTPYAKKRKATMPRNPQLSPRSSGS